MSRKQSTWCGQYESPEPPTDYSSEIWPTWDEVLTAFDPSLEKRGTKMSESEFECQKCGNICTVDGEMPEYFCWCSECNDYATGFDEMEYARQVCENIADGHP